MSFKVSDQEAVEAGQRGQVQAWRVETDQGWIFWISPERPYVIRLEIPTAPAETSPG